MMTFWEKVRLAVDLIMLPFYITWMVCAGIFFRNTPFEKIPERQADLVFYIFWYLVISLHGGACYYDGRHRVMWTFCLKLRRIVRGIILDCLIETFVWDFLRFLHVRAVCLVATALIETLLVACVLLSGAAIVKLTFCQQDAALYSQNFTVVLLYCVVTFRSRDFYDVKKLMCHFAYVCLHGGCVGDFLGYQGGYYAISVGTMLVVLMVLWYLLNWPVDKRLGADASLGKDDRDNQLGDRGNLPKDAPPRWRPKQQRKKRR